MKDSLIKSGKYDWPKAVDCNTTSYFFISYSHRNSVLACHDFSLLASYEIPFWYDDGMVPGQDWKEKAKYAMTHTNCKGVIFYISKASVQSGAVYEELQMAEELMENRDDFSLLSVNIGGKSIESMIKEELIPQKYTELYKKLFPDSTIFIARKNIVSSTEHICYLLDYFNGKGMLKKKYLSVVERNPFVLSPYEGGFIISKFRGEAEEIVIPENIGKRRIIAIGPNAFAHNTKIKKLSIRGDILEIFDSAFEGCSSLSVINLNDSLLRIGNDVFKGCKKIKSITFPSQLKELGSYAFYQCSGLSAVDFNHASLSIGYACFSQCIRLGKVSSVENLVAIDGYAFGGSIFSDFIIHEKVEKLGIDCFVFNPNLEYIYFKRTCLPQDTAPSIVALCPKFKHLVVPINTSESDFLEFKIREHVKKKVQAVSVFSNDEKGFLWNKVEGADQYTITVGNKVFITKEERLDYSFDRENYYVKIISHSFDEEIEDGCFSLNYQLKKPIINGNILYGGKFNMGIINNSEVKEIEKEAFKERLDIKELDFSGDSIGESAFESALNLAKVNFENDVTLGASAFKGCAKLSTVNFDKVVEMGPSCFENCLALEKVILSDKLTDIPPKAFRRAIGLREITLPNGLERLGNESLRGCMGLRELRLPDSITTIEDRALTYLVIRSIQLPQSLEVLGEDNLQSCSYLSRITIENNPHYSMLNSMLVYNNNTIVRFPPASSITRIFTPARLIRVLKNAFRDNSYLNDIYLRNVRVIEKGAFYGCSSLAKVYAPYAEKIESDAFTNCTSLKTIIVPKEVEIEVNAIPKYVKVEYI